MSAVVSPMAYVDYRLWWDVNLDVDKLLDEYFTTLYGPAAPHMKALYELFEEIHMRPRKGGFLYEYNKFPQFRPYTAEDLQKIMKLIADAHASIKNMGIGAGGWDCPEERRLAYTTRSMRVFLNMLEGIVLARELEQFSGKIDDIEVISRLEKIERLNAILDRNDTLYRETLIVNSDASGLHRWAGQTAAIRHAWKNYISEVTGQALVNIYRQVKPAKDVIDKRTKDRMDTAVSGYRKNDLQSVLFSYRAGEIKPGKNLVANPGFETVKKTAPYPPAEILAKRDWGASDLYGWAIYPPKDRATGSFEVSAKQKHSGKQSGLLRGTDTGIFLTMVENLKPGQIYHTEAYVKNIAHVTRIDVPVASLKIMWLDKNHNWTAQSLNSSVSTSGLDAWMRLEQIVQVPENAEKAVILVGATPLYGQEELFIDDISFSLLKR